MKKLFFTFIVIVAGVMALSMVGRPSGAVAEDRFFASSNDGGTGYSSSEEEPTEYC